MHRTAHRNTLGDGGEVGKQAGFCDDAVHYCSETFVEATAMLRKRTQKWRKVAAAVGLLYSVAVVFLPLLLCCWHCEQQECGVFATGELALTEEFLAELSECCGADGEAAVGGEHQLPHNCCAGGHCYEDISLLIPQGIATTGMQDFTNGGQPAVYAPVVLLQGLEVWRTRGVEPATLPGAAQPFLCVFRC